MRETRRMGGKQEEQTSEELGRLMRKERPVGVRRLLHANELALKRLTNVAFLRGVSYEDTFLD